MIITGLYNPMSRGKKFNATGTWYANDSIRSPEFSKYSKYFALSPFRKRDKCMCRVQLYKMWDKQRVKKKGYVFWEQIVFIEARKRDLVNVGPKNLL